MELALPGYGIVGKPIESFALEACLSTSIPRHARSLLRGQTGALRLGVVLLRLRRPCGVSVPPQTSL